MSGDQRSLDLEVQHVNIGYVIKLILPWPDATYL